MLAVTETLPVGLTDVLSPPSTPDVRFPDDLLDASTHATSGWFPSARSALRYALVDAGLDPDDEVLVPGYTCHAVDQAVRAVATPRYVDVGDDFAIDVEDAAECVTERTEAVVPTHLYGVECDVESVAALADDHDLVVVEDAAQALGNLLLSDTVGRYGDYTVVSFRFYKEVTAFKGGLLLGSDLQSDTTRTESRAKRGALAGVWLFDSALRSLPGPVYAPLRERVLDPLARSASDTVDAAAPRRMRDWTERIVSKQLAAVEDRVAQRRENASVYRARLPDALAQPPAGERNTVVRYPLQVPPGSRDELLRRLRRRGIGASPMYSYTVCPDDACPTAVRLSDSVLTIPVHCGLSTDDVTTIAQTVADEWRAVR